MKKEIGSGGIIFKELEKMAPEYNLEEWKQAMSESIGKKISESEHGRTAVNIAGASASGKGEATEELRQQLERQGKKCFVLGIDDFYKGISRMVLEKLPKRIESPDIDLPELISFAKDLTISQGFADKFSPHNLGKISDYLKNKYPQIDCAAAIRAIEEEFAAIDFDTPDAVDLDGAARAFEDLKRGQEVDISQYSMKYSESTGTKKIDGGKYDVIIIEGLYAMNEKISQKSDLSSFIESDPKTLLMRRFRRDVLNGRASQPPETALWAILETVLPAYKKYILPDRKKADIILKNDYTGQEAFDVREYDVQDKIPISGEEAERLEGKLDAPLKTVIQEDYYFTNEELDRNPDHLIRARVENGQLKDLVHKGTRLERADGKIIRPAEYYIKAGEFGDKYKNVDELIAGFKKSGFKLEAQFSKIRKAFQRGTVKITSDEIIGLGVFLELSADNKLSKAPEIENFKKDFGLAGRRSAGPYFDEYLAKLNHYPDAIKKAEILLNSDISKELILRNKLCETLDSDQEAQTAFNAIRQGYPDAPLSEQCRGREFREHSEIILGKLARKTVEKISDKSKAVVLLPWRSGLAFGNSYSSLSIDSFYHLSSKRDEKTLETLVDYECGEADEASIVIIADPMLATGNTMIDAISRVKEKGVHEENIIINSVVAAPIGIAKVKKDFPGIKIIVGALDEKLDHKGYIVPGLGDFGDKYFSGMTNDEIKKLVENFHLDDAGRHKAIERIKKQAIGETLSALLEEDFKNIETDNENRKSLSQEGLISCMPKKTIKIDSGRTKGIENISDVILSEINSDVKIISLEGAGGTGKTSIAEALAEKIAAIRLPVAVQQSQDVALILEKIEKLRDGGKIIILEGQASILDFLPSDLRVKLAADPSIRAERRWMKKISTDTT